MSRKLKLYKDYYDEGYDLYKKSFITIQPGVTVLAGCNGIGKTTLLNQLESKLKKDNIPCILFDNLHDGGSNARSNAALFEDFGFVVTSMCSSEGENIMMNINNLAARLGNFVKTGEDKTRENSIHNAFARALSNGNIDKEEQKEIPKERWILLDAVDSGLSVDNIIVLKEELFQTILKYNFDNEIYIIVSANEYEIARGEQCFDVYNGKYITFKDYEEYRNFIIKSKEWKDQREVGTDE